MATIEEIRARWAQATAGRWTPETYNTFPEDPDCGVMVELSRGRWGWICDIGSVQGEGTQRQYDAIAIAHAPTDIAALLAALDEAHAELGTVRAWAAAQTPPDEVARLRQELAEAQAQIARDAPVLAAAEAMGAARVRRLRAMSDDVDICEFAAADTAYGNALESLSSTLAHRAATTPTP